MLDFGKLNSRQFEEFCFDLLKALNYANVDWRRGANKGLGAADQGRDIECDDPKTDRDGGTYLERVFAQCKHFERAVPPEGLEGVLTWAQAERPAQVLIISSGFLSNPAKEFLESYRRNNKPPFRIRVWELTELEDLTADKPLLLQKYGLSSQASDSDWLHSAHQLYLRHSPTNRLADLFNCLDGLDPQVRDEMLSFTMFEMINPRFRDATSVDEKLMDLMIDEVTYEAFRRKCYQLSSQLLDSLLVLAIVSSTLAYLARMGDMQRLPGVIVVNQKMLEVAKRMGASFPGGESDLKKFTKKREEFIANLPSQTEHFRRLYAEFCETVLVGLFRESTALQSGGTEQSLERVAR